MTVLLPALLLFAPPTEAPPRAEGPQAAPAGDPGPAVNQQPERPAGFDLGEDVPFESPFEVESLTLSDTLRTAMEGNIDLRQRLVDVSMSEATILSAMGAFDVRITAGVSGTLQESTPRGSAFIFSTGSRTLAAYLGFARKLESGGNISLRFDINRNITDQPASFFNPAAGSVELNSYQITPTLTFSHPLLRGMGVKINKAQVERARLATSQAEANERVQAQNLVSDIAAAYWDVLFAKRDLENKRRSLELAKEQLTRTEAQVSVGRLAAVDAKAVEQSLAARESEVLLAENTLLDTSLSLRILMGQDFAERDVLGVLPETDPELMQPQPVDLQGEIKRALAQNPQVRQLELALASKRIDEIEAANQRLPQLDFTATFSPQGRSVDTAPNANSGQPGESGSWGEAFRNFINEDISQDGLFSEFTLTGQLDLTWDVQNRTAKGNHARVLQELAQAELNLKGVRQTVATAVIRAANSMRTAAKRIDVAQVSVELAEQNLDAEQARFDAGRSTNYDVLFRIDELAKAQADALSAQIDYLKARVQLQALNGDILPAFGLDVP